MSKITHKKAGEQNDAGLTPSGNCKPFSEKMCR